MQKSDVLLEIRNIQASYKEYPALNNVSLDIKKNTVLGLVGESGSGKSTLAKVITGLLQADTGEVVFDGEMLYSKKKHLHRKQQCKQIQMVFQNPEGSLNPKAAGAQIGINIEINAQEISTFRSDFRDLNFSMMINSATADYPDANSIFAFQVDPDGWSKCYWTSYNNETAADLMRKGQVTPDGDERAAVYEELQQILADEVPYIPLYNSENVVGLRDNVEGFTVLPNGSVHFEDVYFEE